MTQWTRTRAEGCLSDLRIDRLLRGELSREEAADSRQHLSACATCHRRVNEIEAARARFQEAPIALPRPASRRFARRWTAGIGAGLAAAAAIAISIFAHEPSGTRTKGGSHLGFYVLHERQLRRGQSGEKVNPGDTLQFVYTIAKPAYAAILSVDGAGQVSRYFPDGPMAEALSVGTEQRYSRSTILDEVLGVETIYGLFCGEAVALEPIQAALQQAPTRGPEVPSCQVERLSIEKRRP
jgi:hypothetical protein